MTFGDAFMPHSRLQSSRGSSGAMLVPRASRSVPITWAVAIPIFGAVYAIVALLHPIYGESPLGVLILALLAMLTFGYAVMSPNADILDPMRVVSVYYLIIFCVAPLAAKEVFWHYTVPYPDLVPAAAAFSAAAYLLILIGYHFPTFRPIPDQVEAHHENFDPAIAGTIGMLFFLIGLFSWVVLVTLAGGMEGLLYSDSARGQFFFGFGFFFWGALFMFSGATLYWGSRCVGRARPPWIHALPLVISFICFLTLQGRMRGLNFLILGLFVTHYMIRPLRPSRLAIFGVAGLFLALFIGVARAPSTRVESFLNPLLTLRLILENFDSVGRAFLFSDLSRLRQIVLILDKVPAWMPYDWGESFLMIWNPWMRLLGLTELGGIEGIGPRLFRLAHPEFGYLPTGYLPSFVGEAIVNFPWFLAWIFFVPYGLALRFLYMHLIVSRGDFVAVAMYAILLLQAANILLQSLGHVVFEMIVVLSPFLIAHLIARSGRIAAPVDASEPTYRR